MEIWFAANLHYGKKPASTTFPTQPPAAAAKRPQSARQSVKLMPIRVITICKKRSPGVHLVAEEYMEKIRRYCVVEDIQIKSNPRNTMDVNAQIEGEDAMMMKHIKPNDWVIMLDENGSAINSEQMADLVEDAGKTVLTCPQDFSLNYTCASFT